MQIKDSKVICKYSGGDLEGLKRSCSMGNNGGTPSRVAEKKAAHTQLAEGGEGRVPQWRLPCPSFDRGFPFPVVLQEDPLPLAFYVHDAEIVSSLGRTLESQAVETEKVLDIIYQPQAIFRVRAVTRCTSSLEGHSEAVISVAFSPTGK